jgi:hypothetical protein
MNRLHQAGHRAVIGEALRIIPARLHELVAVDFLCGADPLFLGLHRYALTQEANARSYSTTAHCVYPFHQMHLPADRRATTVVLPSVVTPDVVVHELGHVLHERLRFEPTAAPVSGDARTNRHEAFAEAFTTWLLPDHGDRPDERTLALLEGLAL